MKKKYKWSKRQIGAIRKTLSHWLKVQTRLRRGEKIVPNEFFSWANWETTNKGVAQNRCSLCLIGSCLDCPHYIIRRDNCLSSKVGLLMAFYKHPGKRTVNRIVNFLKGLLPNPHVLKNEGERRKP